MVRRFKKFSGEVVTLRDIRRRMAMHIGMGYTPARWLEFCRIMLEDGYKVTVKETMGTKSKYVRVHGAGDVTFLVRFSEHKPNKFRYREGHCDFWVGPVIGGDYVKMTDAVKATRDCFNAL